ncbi:hypothetical protein GPECTOR_76g806 [Gonium pectorale]|uniref:DNA (cytosine-5-)-methyltransferase n=1 Tax=Gonium pectorale TaxID=33097 RepID=A0A150G2E4_GONPE|nr:hypothetical protein GPECTOR_76g806 [Gonium pectorale]|eukprot:KXZ43984.1 hypothetical protein GPECTOR_76g806 [Gonium pectorale]
MKVGCFFLVAMDEKTESFPTAVIKITGIQEKTGYPPKNWKRMTQKDRCNWLHDNVELEYDWLLTVWDTSIALTHLRQPTRDAVPGDTREFVRRLPDGVDLPPNLLWLAEDGPDKDRYGRLGYNNLIRRVEVHWLAPLAAVPPVEKDVFYCGKSFAEDFKAYRFIRREQLFKADAVCALAPRRDAAAAAAAAQGHRVGGSSGGGFKADGGAEPTAAGGRQGLRGEARVVPFLTACGAVPPPFAGERADVPSLRYYGAGRRGARVLHLCCGGGGSMLAKWLISALRRDRGQAAGAAAAAGVAAAAQGPGSGRKRKAAAAFGVDPGTLPGAGSAGCDTWQPDPDLELVDSMGVDIKPDACFSFLANAARGAVVLQSGVDESLELVRRYCLLCDWLELPPATHHRRFGCGPPDSSGNGGGDGQGAVSAGGGAVRSRAGRAGSGGSSGSGSGSGDRECGRAGGGVLDDIVAMRLVHTVGLDKDQQLTTSLDPTNCWLAVLVSRREGADDAAWEALAEPWRADDDVAGFLWLPVAALLEGPGAHPAHVRLLRDFAARCQAEGLIPRPGDVFAVVGTPSCKHFSGLNVYAPTSDVMADPTNHLVAPILEIVKFLRPPYVLIEQVTGAVKRELAAWLRTTQGLLEAMGGYEHQVADVAAGAQGAAEGRQRIFVVAARCGCPLPQPPCPTHVHAPTVNLTTIKRCRPQAPAGTALRRHSTCWDAIADLEPASNFRLTSLGLSSIGAGSDHGGVGAEATRTPHPAPPRKRRRTAGGGDEGQDQDSGRAAGASSPGASPGPDDEPALGTLLATVQPPPGTPSRDTRTAMAFSLTAASAAKTALCAADIYRLEFQHRRKAAAASAGRSTRSAGGDSGRARDPVQAAREYALEALGAALIGHKETPDGAKAWIASAPTGVLKRRSEWEAQIRQLRRRLGVAMLEEMALADRVFRSVFGRFRSILETELRLAKGLQEDAGAPEGGPRGRQHAASPGPGASLIPAGGGGDCSAAGAAKLGSGAGAADDGNAPRVGQGAADAGGGAGAGGGRGGGEDAAGGVPAGERWVANHWPVTQSVADMQRLQLIPPAMSDEQRLSDVPGIRSMLALSCGERPWVEKSLQDEQSAYARTGWGGFLGVIDCCYEVARRPLGHPVQDRIFTNRELLRKHGVPDFFALCVAPSHEALSQHGMVHGVLSYRTVVKTALRALRVAERLWTRLSVGRQDGQGAEAPGGAGGAGGAAAMGGAPSAASAPGAAGADGEEGDKAMGEGVEGCDDMEVDAPSEEQDGGCDRHQGGHEGDPEREDEAAHAEGKAAAGAAGPSHRPQAASDGGPVSGLRGDIDASEEHLCGSGGDDGTDDDDDVDGSGGEGGDHDAGAAGEADADSDEDLEEVVRQFYCEPRNAREAASAFAAARRGLEGEKRAEVGLTGESVSPLAAASWAASLRLAVAGWLRANG